MKTENRKQKKKKKILVTVSILGGLFLLTGAFWLGRISRENKSSESKNNLPSNSQEIQQLKSQLIQLKSQLNSTSNINRNQIESKLSNLESQINNLSSPDKSTLKKLEQEIKKLKEKLENDNNPNEEDEPNNEDDLISTIFKWSSSDKSSYQLFESDKNNKFKVYIAKNHPCLKGEKLDSSEDTPPFSIRFKKKNVSKQEGDKTFYFDKNNINFELGAFGDWPDESEPKNKKEEKVKFAGEVLENFETKSYCFNNSKNSGKQGNSLKVFYINKNHPQIKELLSRGKLQQRNEWFTIRYGKVDEISTSPFYLMTFNEFNQDLEIIEV